VIPISAKHNIHLDHLEQAVYKAANIPTLTDTDVIITNARHYDALLRAHESISIVLSGMEAQLSGDLLSEDLRQVLSHLSEITGGEITTPEVLGNIFKNFCVGK
jgi:tRNA modification GTPase